MQHSIFDITNDAGICNDKDNNSGQRNSNDMVNGNVRYNNNNNNNDEDNNMDDTWIFMRRLRVQFPSGVKNRFTKYVHISSTISPTSHMLIVCNIQLVDNDNNGNNNNKQ